MLLNPVQKVFKRRSIEFNLCKCIFFYSNDDFGAINGLNLKIKIPFFVIIEEISFGILFFNCNIE